MDRKQVFPIPRQDIIQPQSRRHLTRNKVFAGYKCGGAPNGGRSRQRFFVYVIGQGAFNLRERVILNVAQDGFQDDNEDQEEGKDAQDR